MTKSEIFKAAHELASSTAHLVGDYMIAFSLALKLTIKKSKLAKGNNIMTALKNKIIEMGGKEWTKNGMERVYIDSSILNKLEEEKGLLKSRFGANNNKIFFDVKANAVMRSYKGKKPSIEIQYA